MYGRLMHRGWSTREIVPAMPLMEINQFYYTEACLLRRFLGAYCPCMICKQLLRHEILQLYAMTVGINSSRLGHLQLQSKCIDLRTGQVRKFMSANNYASSWQPMSKNQGTSFFFAVLICSGRVRERASSRRVIFRMFQSRSSSMSDYFNRTFHSIDIQSNVQVRYPSRGTQTRLPSRAKCMLLFII